MEEIFSAVFEEFFSFCCLPQLVLHIYFYATGIKCVKEALVSEYDNQYANAGLVVVLNTIAASVALAMAAMVILALITPILNWVRS